MLLHKGTTIGHFAKSCPEDVICSLGSENKESENSFPSAFVDTKYFLSCFDSIPNPRLSAAENEQLANLLLRYSDIFASSTLDLGRTTQENVLSW